MFADGGEEGVENIGPHCAVAASLAHVVDDEQLVVGAEEFGKGDGAIGGGKGVVLDWLGWVLLAGGIELLGELVDLGFEFLDGGHF